MTELRVYDILIMKHTAPGTRASFSTNNPILFREWAVSSFAGDFTIEHWDELVIPKYVRCYSILQTSPYAVDFDLQMCVSDICDMILFKLAWD